MSHRFYTTQQLGTKQSLTPEGFLLCEDVPLARTGSQIYGEHELPGLKGLDGVIRVMRDEAEVFSPQSIASFAGKPVTNDHPTEKVTPFNHKNYSVGTVLHPRRGDGVNFDNSFLYADLLITDPQAIADVRAGKREVSAGYDAEYEQTNDGEGKQYQIIGNHVALVDRGRCGPMCFIGDEEMAGVRINDRRSFKDRVLSAFRSGDESALVEELAKVEEMKGEQVSGNREEGNSRLTGDDTPHVTINLGGGGGASPPAISTGGGGGAVMRDDPDPVAADPDPGPAVAGGMAEVLQRLDRIEQAIVILAQGDDGDDGDDFDQNNGNGQDDGFRDEAPTEPPSDEPELKPDNMLEFGEGSRESGRDGPQLGSGRTDDRRRTNDRTRRTTTDGARTQAFVGDSSSMQQEFHDTMARANFLVEGIRVPTFDARTPARSTFDTMCSLRRNALDQALRDSEKRQYISAVTGGGTPDFRGMTCDAVKLVFNGASEMARQATNQTMGRARTTTDRITAPTDPASINKMMKQRYGIQ